MQIAYFDSEKSEWVDLGDIRQAVRLTLDGNSVFEVSADASRRLQVRTYVGSMVIFPKVGNSVEIGFARDYDDRRENRRSAEED